MTASQRLTERAREHFQTDHTLVKYVWRRGFILGMWGELIHRVDPQWAQFMGYSQGPIPAHRYHEFTLGRTEEEAELKIAAL
jgi:hypothetical protein